MVAEESAELIRGTVAEVTFRNDDTGFTVLELEDGDEHLTAVGVMPSVSRGEMLELGGTFDTHAVYGRQFRVVSFIRVFPSDSAAILRYLSGGVFKGIGPATAKRIVTRFGNDTFDALMNRPEEVANIKGISYSKALEISKEIAARNSMRDAMRFFASHGFTTEESLKMFGKLGADCVNVVKSEPYSICEEGIDIPFERADAFAREMDCPENSFGRLKAGIYYVLRHNLSNGHTCLPADKLIQTAARFLGTEQDEVERAAQRLCDMKLLSSYSSEGGTRLFLPDLFEAEYYIAARLRLAARPEEAFEISDDEISHIENDAGITFEGLQREALKMLGTSGVLVVTGGPGTGKTTLLKAIIEVLETREMNIALAAPTGRAAKRMSEVTGREAKTLHRLLEVERVENGGHRFKKNANDPLDCDAIIIDEMSMVDSQLFCAALSALRLSCRIILVGDHDQLPSVGAGNVLRDILDSGAYNAVCLRKVFRQALKSNITVCAHKVVNGERITREDNGGDFFTVETGSPSAAAGYISDLCTDRIPGAYGLTLFDGIQVLCPSRRLGLGADSLNARLQETVNPPAKGKREVTFRGFTIREGDKVMQTKNNYDIVWKKDNGEHGAGVFNGDIGIAEKINPAAGTVTVRFDDRTADYAAEEAFQLELAYAVTVHKSQGSEFDCVILAAADVPERLCYRNLLYTAVTRAKKMLITVGRLDTVNRMIDNERKTLRYTGLCDFIKEHSNVV